ncbi:replication/maintenance protein RepL [Staphylococcus shinii]|uniref:replication/maintenance protein RepL n=1 Tax=Staphylococcus shinii TaxID=2912228 RepID=UPI003F4933D8
MEVNRSYCETYNIDERLIVIFEYKLKTMPLYKKLLNDFLNIINKLEHNNINKLTKVEISNSVGLSYTSVVNKMKFLIQYDFIYLKSNGVYDVLSKDIESALPFRIMADIGVIKNYLDLKEENITKFISTILSVNESDVLKAQGYLTYITQSKQVKVTKKRF